MFDTTPVTFTYETGTDEQIHPDINVAVRFIEVAISECEYGCKIYADPLSNVKVLGHNGTYGCRTTKSVIDMEMDLHRMNAAVDDLV